MAEPQGKKKMTVAAVVSLRGLPMMVTEGLSMVFYILFSTVMFLLPASLVADDKQELRFDTIRRVMNGTS